jgi:uncharacterized membrane protein
MLFGTVPVALLGLLFYLFMTAANTPWAWRANRPGLQRARLGSLIAGIAFVLCLIYTELFTLDAICPWCTSVHVITFLLFVLIMVGASGNDGRDQNRGRGAGGERAG